MKNLHFITRCAIFLVFIAIMFASIHCFGETLTVNIKAGDYEVVRSESGRDRIAAPAFGTRQVPGKPAVPSRIFYIAIPPDGEVSKVTFEGDPVWLDGTYDIEPGGISLPARDFDKQELEAARKEYDVNYELTYSQDKPYPSESRRYVGGGGFRKYRFVRVEYSPWQYYPKSRQILYTPEVNVNIEYTRVGVLESHVNLSDTAMEDRAQELLINYKDAQEWYPVQPQPLGSPDYRYVIMCTDATRDAVEPLADWKRSIGTRVKIFTKEELEADPLYTSYELERKIRYYLRDNYQDWNTIYFLIVGDTDVIPMRECTAGDGGTWPSFTDTYYAELSLMDSASWDDDWDGNYAERTEDNIDWAMELAVGRIPDNDPATIQAICEKIRDFEMDTGTWKKRSLHLGAIWNYTNQDGGGGTKSDQAYVYDEMFGDWTWTGWTRYTMYEQAGVDPSIFASTWNLTDTNVRNVWDNGQYALVNMGGHGNDYGIYRRIWQWDDGDGIPEWDNGELTDTPYFDRDDIASLNNNHPSIVFFAACSCGEYDIPNACAKQLLHTGAVATIASTGNVQYTLPWYSEADGRIQTFQYLWNKRHINSGQRVGTALMSAKSDFAASYNWNDGTQQILLNMNLYGDPALRRSGTTLRPNLDFYRPSGWDYVVVPRAANNANSTW